MSAPTKLQRWLDLIALLATRRVPITVDELWAKLPAYAGGVDGGAKRHESVRRMFERDKDELRALGIPIETVTYSVNYGLEQITGYRLVRKDFHLPYLRLVRESEQPVSGGTAPDGAFEVTEDEASAALGGLRHAASLPAFPLARQARSAFRKLAFDLDSDLLQEDPVVYVQDPETAEAAEALRRLSDALLGRKRVSFSYHSIGRDSKEHRTVRPYGLFFQHGRWYLVGFDEARQEPRVFRVGRTAGVRTNRKSPGRADYDVPDDFRLEDYSGKSAWQLGGDQEAPLEATVLFRFPRSMWAERNGHGRRIEEGEDGAQLRSFDVHRRDPFLRWILSLGGDATVTSPEELKGEFQEMAAAVAARHGSVADD